VTGLALAILVFVVGVAASVTWFGVMRRRKAETELGVQALANMKWRDCLAVVLEALARDGYQRSSVSEAPAGGATEVMLSRNGIQVLLDYKHGTAYHLSDSNVREFVNDVSLNGAREGVLVTLGSIGPDAARVAATHAVQLVDGQSLWPKVRGFLVPSLLENVRREASARTNKALWGGVGLSLVAAAVVFVIFGGRLPERDTATVADADVPSARATNARAPRSDAAMLAQIDATAKALEEVAKLTPAQLAERRAAAARTVSDLPRVRQAAWSGPRTLLVSLEQSGEEARDNQLLDEVCRTLVQNEEMRFTRVQLESPAADQRVRWRLCE
jgi:hypothetical protein